MKLPAALSVLGVREFRLLFAGQAISLVGDGMLMVALSFSVLDLTGSVSDLGFVLAAYRGPTVVAVLVGGVVGDRVSRRAVMIVADLIRLGALVGAAELLISGEARLWELLALMSAVGAAAGFFYPAATGLLPLTVSGELLQQANGLRGMSQATGAIVGPAIAGVLVAASGPGWAIAADAASFGVSAASLAVLRLPAHVPLAPQRFLRDLADGWRVVRSRTWVWATIVVAGCIGNLFTPAFGVLGATIARQHLGGASAWAAILSTQGAGSVFGGLLVLRWRPRRPLVASSLAWGLLAITNVLLAFLAPVGVIAAGAFVGGCGLAIGQSLWDTTLQRQIPREALSRVSAYDWFGSLAVNPIGFAVVGPLAVVIGSRTTLLIAATWFVASALILIAVPSVRTMRDDVPASRPRRGL